MRPSIRLPTIDRLTVRNYALYPGPDGNGIDLNFASGVTVIAGINGIGKTTLLQLLLRMLIGPSNPAKSTTHDLGRVGSRQLTANGKFGFFASRVPAPLRADAMATLEFRIGRTAVVVKRSMASMEVRDLKVNGRRVANATDTEFVNQMATLCGLDSGYDYHIAVRHLQFFTEERVPILWSSSTQFELFKIAFLDVATAARLSELQKQIGKLDSEYRTRHAILTGRENTLKALKTSTDSPVTAADFEAQDLVVRAVRKRFDKQRLATNDILAKTTANRSALASLEYEFDDARSELSKADALYINNALPSLDDKLRLLMQGLGSLGCFVCGTRGRKHADHIGKKLRNGHCFVCNAGIAAQPANVTSLPAAKVRKLEAKVAAIEQKMSALTAARKVLEDEYRSALTDQQSLANELQGAQLRLAQIQVQLPQDGAPSSFVEEIEREKVALDAIEKQRSDAVELYREQVTTAQSTMDGLRAQFSERIAYYAKAFLHETVSVRFDRSSPLKVAQGAAKVNIPTFRVAMTSSTHRVEQMRNTESSVSESQKEFLDLAFRMAMLDIVSNDASCFLVIETPEASLDTWFMQRAAEMMRQFASDNSRQLIATSNLNGTEMIPHLLGLHRGGRIRKLASVDQGRLIDLMKLTPPPAILEDREARTAFDAEMGRYRHG